jgi:hypothetical protein
MKKFKTIESWASNLGYIVESDSDGYVWYKENNAKYAYCKTVQDVIDQILLDIKSGYEGEA